MLDISKEGSFAAEVMSFMTAGLTVDSKFQDFPGFSRFFQDLCVFPGLSRAWNSEQ